MTPDRDHPLNASITSNLDLLPAARTGLEMAMLIDPAHLGPNSVGVVVGQQCVDVDFGE